MTEGDLVTINLFDPSIGKQRPLAWLAAADLLEDGLWHSRGDLRPAMGAASRMLAVSCRNLLEEARRDGVLEKRAGAHGRVDYRIHPDQIPWFNSLRQRVLSSIQVEDSSETEVLK